MPDQSSGRPDAHNQSSDARGLAQFKWNWWAEYTIRPGIGVCGAMTDARVTWPSNGDDWDVWDPVPGDVHDKLLPFIGDLVPDPFDPEWNLAAFAHAYRRLGWSPTIWTVLDDIPGYSLTTFWNGSDYEQL